MATIDNELGHLPCLPYEIQDTILRNLTFRECFLLSAVCKTWRSMVLNWQGMWSTLSTEDSHNIASDLEPYRAYINSVSVSRIYLDTELGDHLGAVIDFLMNQKCNAIQKVDIHAPAIPKVYLLDLSAMCGDTLSDVSLSLGDRNPQNITPDMPILCFPNLKKYYYSGRVSETVRPALAGIQNHRLIDMAISIYIDAGEFDVKPFLEATPQLQRLCLNFESVMFTGGVIPTMVCQYCPRLASLVIVNERDSGGRILQGVKDEILKVNDPGLPRLVLRDKNRCYPVAQKILYQASEHMCEMLERMELAGHTVLGEHHVAYLSTLRFPSLTYLGLTSATYYRSTPLCTFLSNSVPNLTHLQLVGLGCADDNVLHALASMEQMLQVLILDSCLHITSSGLVAFMKKMSRRSRCSLKQVTFRSMPSVSQELLDLLASATEPIVLDELTMDGCYSLSLDNYAQALAMPGSFDGIKKLCITLYYVSTKSFPHKDRIERFLEELDSRIMQWNFSLIAYTRPIHPLDSRNYWYMNIGHVEYQRRVKDGAVVVS